MLSVASSMNSGLTLPRTMTGTLSESRPAYNNWAKTLPISAVPCSDLGVCNKLLAQNRLCLFSREKMLLRLMTKKLSYKLAKRFRWLISTSLVLALLSVFLFLSSCQDAHGIREPGKDVNTERSLKINSGLRESADARNKSVWASKWRTRNKIVPDRVSSRPVYVLIVVRERDESPRVTTKNMHRLRECVGVSHWRYRVI